jgi:hypothetical protein
MLQKIFNTNLKHAYDACKSALRDYKCQEVYCDFKSGIIQAFKKSNFHNDEKILIHMNSKAGVIISISVNGQHENTNVWNLELNELQEAVVLELISVKLT